MKEIQEQWTYSDVRKALAIIEMDNDYRIGFEELNDKPKKRSDK